MSWTLASSIVIVYLEVKNNRPDKTQNQLWIAINNILSANVDKAHLSQLLFFSLFFIRISSPSAYSKSPGRIERFGVDGSDSSPFHAPRSKVQVRCIFDAFFHTKKSNQESMIRRAEKNWKFSALHLLCVLSFKVTHSLLYRHTHCETKKGDNLSQCIKINHFRIWLISLFGQKIRWAKQKKWNPIYHCHWWHAWFCLTSSGTLDESQCFKVIFFWMKSASCLKILSDSSINY